MSPSSINLSRSVPLIIMKLLMVLLPLYGRNHTGLGSSPFDRHYSGNHYCFLLLRVLRCFSSPGLPPACAEWCAFSAPGCPIRISADQWLFAPPHSFSQLITSFFASESLGIHRMPLLTFFQLLLLSTYFLLPICQRTSCRKL